MQRGSILLGLLELWTRRHLQDASSLTTQNPTAKVTASDFSEFQFGELEFTGWIQIGDLAA